MKLTLHKIGNLRILLTVIFSISIIFCIGIVAAEEISEFEKLLREALQNNRNNQTQNNNYAENRIPEKVKPKPLSTASRNALPSTVIDAKPVKPKEPIPIRSSVKPSPPETVKPEPVNLNDGWVALKPNEPAIPKVNVGNEKPVLVAEATKFGTPTIDPNASIWDAVPETVSQDPKQLGNKGFDKPQSSPNAPNVSSQEVQDIQSWDIKNTTKPAVNPVVIQPSPSPWDVVTDKKNPEPKQNVIDWNAVANGNIDEKIDEKKDILKDIHNVLGDKSADKKDIPADKKDIPADKDVSADKNVSTDKDVSADSVNKKSESEEANESENPEESGENTPLPIGRKAADKSTPDVNKSTPDADKSTPNANKSTPDSEEQDVETSKANQSKKQEKSEETLSMDAILNALAKESVEEKESGEKQTESNTAKKSDGKSEGKFAGKSDGTLEKGNDSVGSQTVESGERKASSGTLSQTSPETTEQPVIAEPVVPDFDNDDEETEWKLINADRVGDPHSRDKIKLMYDEITNGLKARNITNRYEMWKGYARSTLRSTAGLNTGSELDGRCRLSWYQQLYNEPVQSIFAVEEYSRKLHHALSHGHRSLAEIMPDIRKKMDIPERNDVRIRFLSCATPFEAVNEVKRCLLESQMAHARALSTLTVTEQMELAKNLVPTFIGTGCVNGHTIPNRTFGRRLCNLMEKMDKAGMYDAAESLIPLTNTALLALLDQLPEDAFPTTMISGQKVQRLSTSAGDIIFGGRENNIYDLDSPDMHDVVCIIDLGGNDSYRDGTCDLNRPVLAIIDLHGNDIYSGSKPGIQGSSILGVSVLIDADGSDTYSAVDLAQGSTLGGVGMLFDFAGHDSYKALRRAQGHALEGLGMLIDRKGNDKYRAAMWAQAFGAPGGFGILEDTEGNDHYYCGGLYLDSYPEHPGYDGWGQGVGAGIRQVANGGIGALLEGGGDDNYEVDYFGQGGGYWLGVGFVRDFGGNDARHGSTLMSYSGGPRNQERWTRFANGFGCHYSLGYCFDDNGDDLYGGRIMGTGMAWDLSIGYLCDFNGNDKFTATGGMTQGVGAEGSIGILFTYGGNDQFLGRNQAYSSNNITYHLPSNCGGNFSFLINYGGNDKYGCGASNNSYVQRGSSGGFLIDRPTDQEAADELKALKVLIEKRNQEIAEYDEAFKKASEEAAAKGRKYISRQRRPQPIAAEQPQRLSSVPSFENTAKTGAGTINLK
jgi:hypothetical protein